MLEDASHKTMSRGRTPGGAIRSIQVGLSRTTSTQPIAAPIAAIRMPQRQRGIPVGRRIAYIASISTLRTASAAHSAGGINGLSVSVLISRSKQTEHHNFT